jgi:hypothetical protein
MNPLVADTGHENPVLVATLGKVLYVLERDTPPRLTVQALASEGRTQSIETIRS